MLRAHVRHEVDGNHMTLSTFDEDTIPSPSSEAGPLDSDVIEAGPFIDTRERGSWQRVGSEASCAIDQNSCGEDAQHSIVKWCLRGAVPNINDNTWICLCRAHVAGSS